MLAKKILGIPLVLFRNAAGKATTLLDRCAHLNVPLSLGRMSGPYLECGYHGWRYDSEGICREVPALCKNKEAFARRVQAFPTQEQQGFVWVFPSSEPPTGQPFQIQHFDDARYTRVHYQCDFEASLYSTLENILDVPHTAFLHRGLFRGMSRPSTSVSRGPKG